MHKEHRRFIRELLGGVGLLSITWCGGVMIANTINLMKQSHNVEGILIEGENITKYKRESSQIYGIEKKELLGKLEHYSYDSSQIESQSKVVATDEQNVYLREIYPDITKENCESLLENVDELCLKNIVEDYWNTFIFKTEDYDVLKLEDIETKKLTYICGYLIEKTNTIYNFETNELEVYPTSLVFQEKNMKEVMQLEEALRKDVLAAFHNYLNDNISLSRRRGCNEMK